MALTLKNFATTWGMFPGPCYDPQVAYGECPATMLDILNDERIPVKDLIWAFVICTQIPDNIKRMAAVRFVRETPISDGRFVADLLTDPRSINALNVAERHALGEASDEELRATSAYAAYDAATTASAAATASAYAATTASAYADASAYAATTASAYADASAYAYASAYAAAYANAQAAQLEIIKSFFQ